MDNPIVFALPTFDQPLDAPPPGSDDPVRAWRAWAGQAKNVTQDEREAVARLLQQNFDRAGETIELPFNSYADSRYAVAMCYGSRRVIYVSLADISRAGSRATEFILKHEVGHHVLGHVDCSTSPPKYPNYDEKLADCWAADSSRLSGLRGRDVLVSIAQLIQILDYDPQPPYRESAGERAKYLRTACGLGLPK